MQIPIEGVKKIDLPTMMFSSLGDAKIAKVSDNVLNGLKTYYQDNPTDYHNRVEQLYNDLKGIVPCDNKINNVLYLRNYLEKGLAIKVTNNALKQTWIEYRLIYNAKNKEDKVIKMENTDNMSDNKTNSYILNNFDEIFDKLSNKIEGFNKYVEELKQEKEKLKLDTDETLKEKELLDQEKASFEEYKLNEIKQIEARKKELEQQVSKLENLVRVFDLKISDLIKVRD